MPGERSLLGEADRDRLLAVLREHYAAGRIELAEFDRRAGIVLAASYADEAATALDGLPPMAVPGPAGAPGRSRSRKRHAQVSEPQPGWVPTAERFRDPSSNTIMRVWTDPADGSRHYVPDNNPA
ncbi:MAG TPA: DUF1707 domain-containing protein [Streptosporangiaceae bacterium]